MSHRMLYKCPGPHAIHEGHFDYVVVPNADVEAAIKDGWFLTSTEAKVAHESPSREPIKEQADAPPSREELEQKAKELGLKFDGRTSDRKLSEMIAAELKD